MHELTYLSNEDRARLVEINQSLLGPTEERQSLVEEREEILKRTKPISECNYNELQSLRQQIFDQYQKHASIGSSQAPMFARLIKRIEILEYEILMHNEPIPEKEKDEKPKRKARVSTKSSSYSWTVPLKTDE